MPVQQLVLTALAFGIFAMAAVTLSTVNQLLFAVAGILFLWLAGRLDRWSPELSRVLIIVISAFLSMRYMMFRATGTLGYMGFWDLLFMSLLFGAETYGVLIHFLGMFVNLSPLRRRFSALPRDPALLPTVDVFIPTYDEPVDMVFTTVVACTQLDYPLEKLNIYVLDDGGTREKLTHSDRRVSEKATHRSRRLREMAGRLGVHYSTRNENVSAKAGNINASLLDGECRVEPDQLDVVACVNHGVGVTAGELILVLDCDHVPTHDLLKKTVGFFLQDPKLFLVQTPHFFINPTPVEKNLETYRESPAENEMFYGAVHPGLDFWNASFFCGSAALLRRSALVANGGLAGDTITEDAETALELHSRGYNSLYFNKPMTIGLSPESFDDFIVQRSRWAQGMVQILLLKNPLFRPGLTAAQRICYLNACLFWFFGFARIMFFIAPLLFLFLGMRVYNASVGQVLLFGLPHLIAAYFVTNRLFGRLRHPFFSELFETIQSIFLVPAIVAVFFRPRSPNFRVTSKSIARKEDRLTPLAIPFYIMFMLTLIAYPAAAIQYTVAPALAGSIVICLVWNTFNMLLMLCCLGVVWERRQLRSSHRYPANEPARVRVSATGETRSVRITDLSATGAGLEIAGAPEFNHEALILLVRDSKGNQLELPMKVTRRQLAGDALLLGCQFVLADDRTIHHIIGFVFGDSRRWKYSDEIGLRQKMNTITGLGNLMKIGLRGAAGNLKGICRAGLSGVAYVLKKLRPGSTAADENSPVADWTHHPPQRTPATTVNLKPLPILYLVW